MDKLNPCRRVCKLDDQQTCIGCGRRWCEIRDWSFYSIEQKQEVVDRVKNFVSKTKSEFD